MTRLKNIQMIVCIPLTMTSFLFGDKANMGNDKLDEEIEYTKYPGINIPGLNY